MKILLVIVLALALSNAFSVTKTQEDHHQSLWESFKTSFEKMYHTEDEVRHRYNVFKTNLDHVNAHQEDDQHAEYAISQFSDLTPQEFESKYLKLAVHKINEKDIPQQEEDSSFGFFDIFEENNEKLNLPKNFDWRDRNVVTEPKAQSSCGACWAFATAAIVEAQYALKHGKLVNFSEQQLIDCDHVDDGCGGGLMTDAYKFLQENGGLELKTDYGKYLNKQGKCHFNKSKATANISSFYQISKDENAMQKELYKNGPIAVGINGRFLQFYDGGIMNNEKCDDKINHAVVIVGYGEESDGTKFWTVKNQWGKQWGNGGYFKLIRGEKRCGIHTYASIAFLE